MWTLHDLCVEILNHRAEGGPVEPGLEVSDESAVTFAYDPEDRSGPDSQKLCVSWVDGLREREIIAHYRWVVLMIPVNWTV